MRIILFYTRSYTRAKNKNLNFYFYLMHSQVVFNSLAVLVNCLLKDHLPGGVLDSPSEELHKSVPSSNIVSERDFAKLDRFL